MASEDTVLKKQRAFIIGGTGQIGIATAEELMRRGWRVTLSHSGRNQPKNVPAGAEIVIVDRRDGVALAEAIGTTDLLVDTIAFNGADADQLAGLAGRFGQLAVISTASVYEDDEGRSLETAVTLGMPVFPGPVPETAPVITPGPANYSSAKVELENRLRETIGAPLLILRPCAIHGINSKHPREWWFVKRMLDGRTRIPLAGGGVARFHTSATTNIAALMGTLAGERGTHILNAGDPAPPTLREIGETIAAHLGWSGEFVDVPADAAIGQTAWSVPSPIVVAMQAAEALGYTPAATYAEATAPYVAWMTGHAEDWRTAFPVFQHYGSDPFDYAAEDAILG